MRAGSILPFPTPASPEAVRQAQADLARAFRRDLARAVAAETAEEEPSYELLEQYVQGRLDAEAAERLESRAAVDSNLAREIDELVALRTRLRPAAPPARPEMRPAARIFRLAVLAATLLVAVIGLDRTLERRSAGSTLAGHATAPAPLYADGFESGDASAWSN